MNFEIKTTKLGRRYFTVDESSLGMGEFTNGYIEVPNNAPHDYSDKFYDQFNFWCGATYSGIVFPNVEYQGGQVMISPRMQDQMQGNFDYEHCIKGLNGKGKALVDGQPYFYVIGFDDNHIETLGREAVIKDTQRIANEMDKVMRNET
ncbi:hypothetical protein MUDAN_DOGOELCO_02552 [Lactiplantibacillus mudanjiangensis]|uniref:hypothetical protein n=1 Tax=Lactiplantibacillus mudanjiangensis TaxID=1296538 RepID=UPI001015175C|nr:hypothetical protein [Lactiplantibacillus mudanjiangensis]VDG33361.1 hypothetical protein MUDAN_DOGOELCO_02552 [Lactiplantibacillus mudanjiangensis]